ncbi:hypothetical protein [Reinekea sp.]|jgi:hypothetical protein|uniref:hypothetical protein n=1 Tax=Reinekea sp. TaxID=1970455 RepID=UPI002A8181C5|nr:hypothetical protein [Reinekea sp.]
MVTWLPILAILFIIGSFMWLKPSPRDQFLAKLRSRALTQGFRLGSLRVPDTSDYGRVKARFQMVTLYTLPLQLAAGPSARFTVLRTTGEAGTYLPEGWAWDEREGLSETQYEQLHRVLTSLPVSIQLISLSSDSIGLNWDERDPDMSFERLKAILVDVAQVVQQALLAAT